MFGSIRGPVPRIVKILRIWDWLHEKLTRGDGDTLSQRRTLARWQKFDRMRREEWASLIP
jgi:hypothetical protein